MRILFAAISMLLTVLTDANLRNCNVADWVASLDKATWSKCPKSSTYLRGLWRNDRLPGDERVGRIEHGWCCPAKEHSYDNEIATCSNANWRHTLDG